MSNFLEVSGSVLGGETVTARLAQLGEAKRRRVAATVKALGVQLQGNVKSRQLSGQVLNVRTGRLRRSINMRFEDDFSEFKSSVGTNVVYGRAWELGFTRPARVIEAVKAKALSWPGAAHPVRSVSQPAKTMAPRPFLVPALEAMKGEIRLRLMTAMGVS